MSGTVKLKLRDGTREIELEGSRADVDGLLEKWWPKKQASLDGEEAAGAPSGRIERRIAKRNRSSSRAPERSEEDGIDPNTVANEMKDATDFGAIEQKILHADGRTYEKVALPIWFTKRDLTSGDVHRILQALHVRITLSGVSTTLQRNIQKFTTSRKREAGGPPAAYQLTAKARADFDKWLRAEDEA